MRRHLQARVVHLALRGVQLALRRRDLLVEVFVKLGEFLVGIVELVSKRLATTNILRHDRLASRLELPATLEIFRRCAMRSSEPSTTLCASLIFPSRARMRSPSAEARAESSSCLARSFTAWSFCTRSFSLTRRNSLILTFCSFFSLLMCSSALVYLVAEKISSNFFLSVAASPRGQLGIFLMHEDDVLENRLGDAHHVRDGGVDVGALAGDGDALAGVLVQGLDHLVEVLLLELPADFCVS